MSLDLGELQDSYICAFFRSLDCPRSLACWLLYSNNEHKQLVELDFNPYDYNSLSDARDSLSATKFLSKATFLTLDVNLKEVAMKKFFESEHQCSEANRRIERSEYKNQITPTILMMASRKICSILGDFTADEFVDACNWGPGATTSLKRREATHPTKFDVERRITVEAYDFVAPWFRSAYPHWGVQLEIAGASKIVTVPKNAKTDRTIAIEPGINLWFQKGIGKLIRMRLKRVGIDLNDQSHNQKKSRLASLHNDVATVDFSAASDTICKSVVSTLLPLRWHTLLDTFRSRYGSVGSGKPAVYFEKFSSMGNGFTFELESLIFYALAHSATEWLGLDAGLTSVFGDDVILPSSAFDLYCSVCADLGFTVNREKSYKDSYYRESCGSHYWGGRCIKPIFQKEPLNDKTAVLKAANNVRRLAVRRNSYGCDSRLRRCWQLLAKALGSNFPRISEGYGDIGLIENIDHPDVVVVKASNQIEGWYVKIYAVSAVQREFDSAGLGLFKLKSIGDRRVTKLLSKGFDVIPEAGAQGNLIPLPERTRLARKRVLVPRWEDLGPWT